MIDFVKQQRIVVFDTETSEAFKRTKDGKLLLVPEKARLIQIGWVVIENGKVTNEVFEEYVLPEPGYRIEDEIIEITGIQNSDIQQGISEKEAVELLLKYCGENRLFSGIAGQNIIGFDLPIINYHINNRIVKSGDFDYTLPTSFYDTLTLAKKMKDGKRGGNKNSELAEQFGIDLEEVKKDLTNITGRDFSNATLHTALYDAMVTAKVLEKMIEEKPELFF